VTTSSTRSCVRKALLYKTTTYNQQQLSTMVGGWILWMSFVESEQPMP